MLKYIKQNKEGIGNMIETKMKKLKFFKQGRNRYSSEYQVTKDITFNLSISGEDYETQSWSLSDHALDRFKLSDLNKKESTSLKEWYSKTAKKLEKLNIYLEGLK